MWWGKLASWWSFHFLGYERKVVLKNEYFSEEDTFLLFGTFSDALFSYWGCFVIETCDMWHFVIGTFSHGTFCMGPYGNRDFFYFFSCVTCLRIIFYCITFLLHCSFMIPNIVNWNNIMTIYRRVHEGKQLKDECNLCGKHVYNLGKCDNIIGYFFFFFFRTPRSVRLRRVFFIKIFYFIHIYFW